MDSKQVKIEFGLRIMTLRRRKQLTQAVLAEQAGLHRTFISKIETGRANVSLETMNTLAHVLECKLHDLVKFDHS